MFLRKMAIGQSLLFYEDPLTFSRLQVGDHVRVQNGMFDLKFVVDGLKEDGLILKCPKPNHLSHEKSFSEVRSTLHLKSPFYKGSKIILTTKEGRRQAGVVEVVTKSGFLFVRPIGSKGRVGLMDVLKISLVS